MRYTFAFTTSVVLATLVLSSFCHADTTSSDDKSLDEVIVTATLRPHSLLDTVYSATVIDSNTLKEAGEQHLEDVLGLIPNLNWDAGTSRPQFFQIRGIGEPDQYQGAPNPGIGFLVDDIDFSGLGGLATLFDVDQVEVLRGPQGITYGADALGGLIKVKTMDPEPRYEMDSEAGVATYGTGSLGAVIGGPLDIGGPDSAFRLVTQQYRSDGFRQNLFLNRDSTNGLNELTTRGKLRFDLGEWRLDVTGVYVNQDNGYDAWSIDNSFNTQSDYPGRDAQRSKAIAFNLQYQGWSAATLQSITTYSAVNSVYSFDDDWGNNQFWLDTTGYSPYGYYSDLTRERTTRTQEIRLASRDEVHRAGRWGWITGVYIRNLREDDSDVEFAQDMLTDPLGSTTDLISRYVATNKAAYGQVEYDFTSATTLNAGLRYERRDASYVDSYAGSFANPDTPLTPSVDNLLGTNLSLIHHWSADHATHIELARSYKAGGVNIGSAIPDNLRTFGPEYLWDMEVGDRGAWLHDTLTTDVSLFYMARRNMQVSSSTQDPGNPAAFIFIIGNAPRGENYGAEFNTTYRLTDEWKLFGTASWLRTRYINYEYTDTYTGELHDLNNREQVEAPSYQFSLGFDWHHPNGWMARIDLSGRGSVYFETSSDASGATYQLVNAKVGYEQKQWSVHLWVRNLLDKRYATQGFFFGNEPPDFTSKLYIQNGDPRQVGVTVSFKY